MKFSKKILGNENKFNCAFEVKTLDNKGKFTGYASIFGRVDSHMDIIEYGAFNNSIKNIEDLSNIKLLWQHKQDEPIGYFTKIIEDQTGLYVEGELLLEIQRAYEAYNLLKANVLNSLSIGFTPISYDVDHKTGVRTISELKLWEISIVTFPANNLAQITSLKNQNFHQNLQSLSKAIDYAFDILSTI